MYSDPSDVPAGYDEDNEKPVLGRPKEKLTKRNTQDDNFGKDRLGVKGMKKDYNDTDDLGLTLEANSHIHRLKNTLSKIPINKKQIVFEEKNKEGTLLDESNIKEQ